MIYFYPPLFVSVSFLITLLTFIKILAEIYSLTYAMGSSISF